MIKVALYIRVSTEEQHLHGLSLDAQKSALIEHANAHNMQIVDIYADEGITARKRLDKRKEFQRLMRDVQDNKIDLILVTKLDRWFRNIKDYYNTQDILEKNNCNWRTIFENYDTTTAGGRLHINIMLSVNQDECDRTSERIKAVFTHKLEKGEAITGALPLGYKIENKRLVLDDNADKVRDMFDYFLLHQNKSATVRHMRENNGLNLCYGTVSNMLKNTLYKGEYKGIKDYCPAIITEEEYDRAQISVKRNIRTHATNRTYTYAGLLVCSECGHNLAGVTSKNSGRDYKQYRCSHYVVRKLCSHKRCTSEKKIDKFIADNLQKELSGYVARYEVKENVKDFSKQRAALNRKMKRLKELYVNELIELEEYKQDLNKIRQELDAIPSDRVKSDLSHIHDLLKQDISTIYLSLESSQKQALIRSVIKRIIIDNENNMKIEFL